MKVELMGIRVKNFKSFKDQYISLKQFNVLVGKNSSGKTNFLDIFKFLKLAFKIETPYDPPAKWWGYRNLTHFNDITIPITFEFDLKIKNMSVNYSVSFGQTYGKFSMTKEQLNIESIGNFIRNERNLEVIYNQKFINQYKDEIYEHITNKSMFSTFFDEKDERIFDSIVKDNLNASLSGDFSLDLAKEIFPYPTTRTGKKRWYFYGFSIENKSRLRFSAVGQNPLSFKRIDETPFFTYTKEIKDDKLKYHLFLFPYDIIRNVKNFLINLFSNSLLLRNIDYDSAKQARFPSFQDGLFENGSNVVNILYKWYIENNGILPDIFNIGLEKFFPEISISFSLFQDGQVFMKVKEKKYDLVPPLISEGFIKYLILLTLIEIEPSMILIDEIENSLYADMIRYLISEFKSLDSTVVIITTHSPVVVDLINLDDLLLVERKIETQIKRIKNIQKLRHKLNELKITNSESWLYGDLYSYNEDSL